MNYASGVGVADIINNGITISNTKSVVGTGSIYKNTANSFLKINRKIPANTNGYTFSMWIYFTNTEQGDIVSFTYNNTTNPTDSSILKIYKTSSSITVGTTNTTRSGQSIGAKLKGVYNYNSNFLNTWHHIVWTLDKNNINKFYLNGILVSTINNVIYYSFEANDNYIFTNSSNYGYLENFRYYNFILSESEVVDLYKMKKKNSGLKWKAFYSIGEGGSHDRFDSYSPTLRYHDGQMSRNFDSFQYDPYFSGGAHTRSSNSSNLLKNISYNNNIANEDNIFGFRSKTNNQRNWGGFGVSLVITGYFKPKESGTWLFEMSIPNRAWNDDMSIFWIDDKADVRGTKEHWPPNDNNYNNFVKYDGPNSAYTTTLNSNTYYPIQISWGQTRGDSILGFYFQGPGTNGKISDGNGYFFSDS